MASFTLNIDDTKFENFKIGFLKSTPIPVEEETGDPLFTDNKWIKEYVKRVLQERYRKGKIKLAREVAIIDNDIVS